MELIYLKKNGESGYLSNFSADFDISNDAENYTNTFQIKQALTDGLLWTDSDDECLVFVDGTEYGGIISRVTVDIEANEVTYLGQTWRGLQSLFVIEPPAGQGYLVVNGNVKDCLEQFPMHPIIEVAETTYASPSYQVARYVKTYQGISGLLKGLSLLDSYVYDEATGKVTMSVAPARDLTGLVDLSQDYGERVKLTITRDGLTPRQLIALGQGELTEREVIHLYAAPPNWTISQTGDADAYPQETYENTSSTNLLTDARKKYQEIIRNHTQISVDIYDLDVRLGDIIAAKDYITGETAIAEVSRIIWKAENYGAYQTEGFQYETKVRA